MKKLLKADNDLSWRIKNLIGQYKNLYHRTNNLTQVTAKINFTSIIP